MLPPTPSTRPSLRCSSAAEHIELANPVTGTADPAPAHCAILSYTPRQVSTTEIKISTATVGLLAAVLLIPARWTNISCITWPNVQMTPPTKKARKQLPHMVRPGSRFLANVLYSWGDIVIFLYLEPEVVAMMAISFSILS